MKSPGLAKAIQIMDSQKNLAAALGVSEMAVSQWKVRRVPAERVLQIEVLTGVPRYELRPDIYPRGESA